MRCALSTLVGYELISILFICLETRALGEETRALGEETLFLTSCWRSRDIL